MAEGSASECQFRQVQLTLADDRNTLPASIWLAKFSAEDRKIHLNNDALCLLKRVPQNKPIAVLSICGPYRSGKSFFLSRMLGTSDAFKVSSKMGPCTEGIWMSTVVLECNNFVVVLVDTEGTDATRDLHHQAFSATDVTKLLVLTTLLSSYLIYNTTGALKQSNLNEMSCFSHIAESILIREGSKMSDHLEHMQSFFPKFLWLLRDNMLEPDIKGELVSVTDYVKRNILVQSGQGSDYDEIVRTILSLFPSLECRQTPPPSKPIVEDQTFLTEIDKVAQFLLANIQPKVNFEREIPINGSILASLAEQYAHALNEPDAMPNLEVTWLGAVKHHIAERCEALVTEYCAEMERIVQAEVPLEEGDLKNLQVQQSSDTLAGRHQKIYNAKINLLQTEVAQTLPLNKELSEQLILVHFQEKIVHQQDDGTIKGHFPRFVEENHKHSQNYCEKVFERLYKEQEALELVKLEENYHKEAIGPAKVEVYDKETKHISGPPLDVKIETIDFRTVKVTWNRPDINPTVVRRYEVHVLPGRNTTWTKYATHEAATKEIEVKVEPNTQHKFRIRGVSDIRNGPYSEVVQYKSPAGKPEKPQKPSFTIESPTKAYFHIQRLPKEKENGSAVTHVIVENRIKHSDWDSIHVHSDSWLSIMGSSAAYNIHVDLTKNNPYSESNEEEFFYQVRLKNKMGESEPSDYVVMSTKEMHPGSVQDINTIIDARKIQIRWQYPKHYPSAVQYFQIRSKKAVENDSTYTKESRHEECRAVIDDLEPDTKYAIQVRGANDKHKGKWHTVYVKTKPDCPNAPSRPDIDITSHDKATLRVKPLTKGEENGKPVRKVIVQQKKMSSLNQGEWKNVDLLEHKKILSKASIIAIDVQLDRAETNDLTCFRVLMENEIGVSPPSEEVQVTVCDLMPGPIGVVTTTTTTTSIMLRWELPYNAAAVCNYQIQVSSDGEDWKTYEIQSHPSTSEFNISDLKSYTNYNIRMRPLSTKFEGEFKEVEAHTKADRPLQPHVESLHMHDSDPTKAVIRFYRLTPEEERGSQINSVQLQWSYDSDVWNQCTEWNINRDGRIQIIEKEFKLPEEVTRAHQPRARSTFYHIIMCSDHFNSEPSEPQVVESASLRPGCVVDLNVIETQFHSVKLQWRVPEINSDAIKRYVINCYDKQNKQTRIQSAEVKRDCETIEMRSLPSGRTYIFEVYAKTDNCIGHQCEIPGATREIIFGPPRNIRAEFRQRKAIKVRWTKPNFQPGAPTDSPAYYKVSVHSVRFLRLTRGMSTVIKGLEPSSEYTVEVTSFNENGNSDRNSVARANFETTMSMVKRVFGTIAATIPTLGTGGAFFAKKTEQADDINMQETDEEYVEGSERLEARL